MMKVRNKKSDRCKEACNFKTGIILSNNLGGEVYYQTICFGEDFFGQDKFCFYFHSTNDGFYPSVKFELNNGRDLVVSNSEYEGCGVVLYESRNMLKSKAVAIITGLIEVRQQLRKQKNFVEADFIRQQLNRLSVLLQDYPRGTFWYWKEDYFVSNE